MRTMYLFQEKKPEGKFVAFFNDGSGATVFFKTDNGLFDAEGNGHDEADLDSYIFWMPVDEKYKLWFEERGE